LPNRIRAKALITVFQGLREAAGIFPLRQWRN